MVSFPIVVSIIIFQVFLQPIVLFFIIFMSRVLLAIIILSGLNTIINNSTAMGLLLGSVFKVNVIWIEAVMSELW